MKRSFPVPWGLFHLTYIHANKMERVNEEENAEGARSSLQGGLDVFGTLASLPCVSNLRRV